MFCSKNVDKIYNIANLSYTKRDISMRIKRLRSYKSYIFRILILRVLTWKTQSQIKLERLRKV